MKHDDRSWKADIETAALVIGDMLRAGEGDRAVLLSFWYEQIVPDTLSARASGIPINLRN